MSQSDFPLVFIGAENLQGCSRVVFDTADCEDIPDFVNVKQEILGEEFSQSTIKLKIEPECCVGSAVQIGSDRFLILGDLKTETGENEGLEIWNTVEDFGMTSEEASSTFLNMEKNSDGVSFVKFEVNLKDEDEGSSISSYLEDRQKLKEYDDQILKMSTLKTDPSQEIKPADKLKCSHCNYETTQKYNLRRHQRRHKGPDEVEMFQCGQCTYKTIDRSCLKRHLHQHKDPKEGGAYKCSQCTYTAYQRCNLKRHQLRHNADTGDMFHCDWCTYKTIYKSHLARHLLQHQSPEEVKMFKCDWCEYKTMQNSHLKTHLLRHANPEDLATLKCAQCSFTTIHRNSLKIHLLRHASPEEGGRFKCDRCEYNSFRKDNLKRHLLQHSKREDGGTFSCDRCSYKAIRMDSLKKHLLRHA